MLTENQLKRNELTRVFAIAYMERADPDGGFGYALDFAKSIVQHYDTNELNTWFNDIEEGNEVEYLPDFGDFELVDVETD